MSSPARWPIRCDRTRKREGGPECSVWRAAGSTARKIFRAASRPGWQGNRLPLSEGTAAPGQVPGQRAALAVSWWQLAAARLSS